MHAGSLHFMLAVAEGFDLAVHCGTSAAHQKIMDMSGANKHILQLAPCMRQIAWPRFVQASAEAEVTRAAILEELRRANEYELDAAARKAEAEAKRASALHKLLRDEQLAAERTALPAVVRCPSLLSSCLHHVMARTCFTLSTMAALAFSIMAHLRGAACAGRPLRTKTPWCMNLPLNVFLCDVKIERDKLGTVRSNGALKINNGFLWCCGTDGRNC